MEKDKDRLKAMIRELGEAISNSLVESDSVQSVLKRIKERGYHVDLSLAIGVGLYREQQEDMDLSPSHFSEDENLLKFEMNQNDLEFLRSLHIKIDKEGRP